MVGIEYAVRMGNLKEPWKEKKGSWCIILFYWWMFICGNSITGNFNKK